MRLRSIAITLILTLLVIRGFRAADTLPASVPDAMFWGMISDFSERGGTFAFEMYMSNEVTFQDILPDLLKRVAPGGVYLFGPLARSEAPHKALDNASHAAAASIGVEPERQRGLGASASAGAMWLFLWR